MREATVRDVEGFSDPLSLQALAFRVRLACQTAARREGAVEDKMAVERASRFLRHARQGIVLGERGGHSATPSLDLLLAGYTRDAMIKIYEAAANGAFPKYLDALTSAFDRAAVSGELRAQEPWTPESLQELWAQIFRIASEAAADPTDRRLSDRSYSI